MLTGPDDITGLVRFAEEALDSYRLPNGLYCFDRAPDIPEARGESVRYSIMVLLGLLRLNASGHGSGVVIEELHRAISRRREHLGVGDLGLLLWAEARMGATEALETLARLESASSNGRQVARLEGMEVAWLVIGASQACAARLPAQSLAERAIGQMRTRKSPTSPLYRHTGRSRGRALLPNFATEIYTLLALCEVAGGGLSDDALGEATRLADVLISLREPDGGWPWLFHADRAVVAESYEVYSVHQDAMAPMALFALTEVSGDEQYAAAAVESFRWCFGNNPLGLRLFEEEDHFVYRSIRRQGWAQRTDLAFNAALSVAGVRTRVDFGGVTLERTCRPYHLGWILEAWAGRDQSGRLTT